MWYCSMMTLDQWILQTWEQKGETCTDASGEKVRYEEHPNKVTWEMYGRDKIWDLQLQPPHLDPFLLKDSLKILKIPLCSKFLGC